MKKIFLLFITVVGILSFSACSDDTPDPIESFDFGFSQAIGLSEQEVYDKLELTADALSENKQVGRYDIHSSYLFEGMDFSEYLLFEKANGGENVLYGGGWEHITKNDDALYDKVTKIMNKLTTEYGEPVTYPELSTKISDKTDFSEYTLGHLTEQWNGKDNCQITLNINFINENAVINIECTRVAEAGSLRVSKQ